MRSRSNATGAKQRLVAEFAYAAKSWPHERRVLTRLEWGAQGHNPRFVVTFSRFEYFVCFRTRLLCCWQ